jgi:hypothetical protein
LYRAGTSSFERDMYGTTERKQGMRVPYSKGYDWIVLELGLDVRTPRTY